MSPSACHRRGGVAALGSLSLFPFACFVPCLFRTAALQRLFSSREGKASVANALLPRRVPRRALQAEAYCAVDHPRTFRTAFAFACAPSASHCCRRPRTGNRGSTAFACLQWWRPRGWGEAKLWDHSARRFRASVSANCGRSRRRCTAYLRPGWRARRADRSSKDDALYNVRTWTSTSIARGSSSKLHWRRGRRRSTSIARGSSSMLH